MMNTMNESNPIRFIHLRDSETRLICGTIAFQIVEEPTVSLSECNFVAYGLVVVGQKVKHNISREEGRSRAAVRLKQAMQGAESKWPMSGKAEKSRYVLAKKAGFGKLGLLLKEEFSVALSHICAVYPPQAKKKKVKK